jgi:hypothetical protein
MNITETLKAQLKSLETERKTHEKAANLIRKKEVKVRQAVTNLASLSNSTTPAPATVQA